MFAFDRRLRLAAGWLTSRIASVDDERAGWGWVADVHPNPQNTAEAVLAYVTLGEPVPQLSQVVRLLESEEVVTCHGQQWRFDTNVDLAFRLRSLACLARQDRAAISGKAIDRLGHQLRERFVDTGWPIAGGDEISVFGTSMALQALGAAGHVTPDDDLVRAAWDTMNTAAVNSDAYCPLATRTHALACLAYPNLKGLRSGRSERAMRTGATELLRQLDECESWVEEETFYRGSVLDRWRHVILSLALHAVAVSNPSTVTDPVFRRQFTLLCNRQELEGVNEGGFATTQHGLVTSYATTQSIAAIAAVEDAIETQPDPSQIIEMLFHRDGRHHTDPQVLVSTSRHQLLANSGAALAAAVLGTLLAATAVIPLALDGEVLSASVRRGVYGINTYLVALIWYGYLMARFPHASRVTIGSVLFAVVTAVLFPLLSLLI